jgi:hypothetical protein
MKMRCSRATSDGLAVGAATTGATVALVTSGGPGIEVAATVLGVSARDQAELAQDSHDRCNHRGDRGDAA